MIPITFQNSVEIINYIKLKYNNPNSNNLKTNIWDYKVYITESIALHCDMPSDWLGGSPDMYEILSDLQHNVVSNDGCRVFKILSNRFLLDKFIKIILKENKNVI